MPFSDLEVTCHEVWVANQKKSDSTDRVHPVALVYGRVPWSGCLLERGRLARAPGLAGFRSRILSFKA